MFVNLKWKKNNCRGYSYDKTKRLWCAEVMIMHKKYRRFAKTADEAAKLREKLVLFRDGVIELKEV